MSFHRGETIICSIEIKDSGGTLVDPATSVKITITDFQNGFEVDAQDMVKDATGKYHYDFTSSATSVKGLYKVYYTDTDGARITKEVDTFEME